MPQLTPRYDWHETATGLEVRVHLPGASRARTDVFATSALIKVNSPGYLLLLDLHKDVDEGQSTATLDGEGVTFKLVKVGHRHVCWAPSVDVDSLATLETGCLCWQECH